MWQKLKPNQIMNAGHYMSKKENEATPGDRRGASFFSIMHMMYVYIH